jgi:Ca-activated chloride channel homolog
MTFGEPLRLLVLLAVPAILLFAFIARRRRARHPVAFTNLTVLAGVASARRHAWTRMIPLALLLLALVFAVVAVAHPRRKISQPDQNGTIVLLVDVSGSMRATDVKPTRLLAAVDAMSAFLNQLPKQFKVGLVDFSDTAEPLVSPTTNRVAIKQSINLLQPEAGTAIGDGIAAALHMLSTSLKGDGYVRKPGKLVPGAIILLSDGAQNRGLLQPLQAALMARAEGVRIYPVSLGTPNGKVSYGIGAFTTQVPAPPDPATMSEIAHVSDGKSFTAQTDSKVVDIYKTLGSRIGRTPQHEQIASWFAGLAAAFLLAAVAAGVCFAGRLP